MGWRPMTVKFTVGGITAFFDLVRTGLSGVIGNANYLRILHVNFSFGGGIFPRTRSSRLSKRLPCSSYASLPARAG